MSVEVQTASYTCPLARGTGLFRTTAVVNVCSPVYAGDQARPLIDFMVEDCYALLELERCGLRDGTCIGRAQLDSILLHGQNLRPQLRSLNKGPKKLKGMT